MQNQNVINALNGILADSIVMYQKLHHYHWRVRGQRFFQLHGLFEGFYNEFAGATDDVAERILMIGGEPIGGLRQALELADVKEDLSVPAARDMVVNVAADLGNFRSKVRAAVAVAEEAGDRGSANLLDPIADGLDKHLWMLDAFLAE
jgi:starvation-inducible DNA-binding protein